MAMRDVSGIAHEHRKARIGFFVGSYGRSQRESKGFGERIVELRALDLELVADIVFGVGGKAAVVKLPTIARWFLRAPPRVRERCASGLRGGEVCGGLFHSGIDPA